MQHDDAELFRRMAAGDRGALAALHDRHAPRLLGWLAGMLRNRSDADDVLQETFLQAWRQAGRFDPARSAAFGWLCVVARSRALDFVRRRTVRANAELCRPAADVEPSPAQPAERREIGGRVRGLVEALPPEQGEAIRLAFFDELSHVEIAARLGAPLGTVKTRIRRGMSRLREQLAGKDARP